MGESRVRLWSARAGLLLAVVGLAACRQAGPTGASAFTLVEETGAPMPAPTDAAKMRLDGPVTVDLPPKPVGLQALPEYPKAALGAGLRDVEVAVTLTIDRSGRVSEVGPSLARIPYTTAFHAEFLAAAEKAVRTWQFEPGQSVHLEPQADHVPVVTGAEAEESRITVAFTFSQSGRVRSDSPVR